MTTLSAAVVQTEPRFGDVEANREAALALVPARCDLAVLPELMTTGYQFRDRAELASLAEPVPDGPTCDALRTHAARTGTTLVAGLAEAAGEKLFNTAVLVRPDGTVERYRKLHLFWDEKLVFDAGDLGLPVFAACGTTVGMMICFDWLFPEATGTLARRGARVIAHPSNLVLPHGPDAMPIRALENRVFTLTANRVGTEHRGAATLRFIGRSAICSPRAERLAECGAERPEAAVRELDLRLCNPQITPRNHVVADRRPEFYAEG
jgi:predicted amidohydrolase